MPLLMYGRYRNSVQQKATTTSYSHSLRFVTHNCCAPDANLKCVLLPSEIPFVLGLQPTLREISCHIDIVCI
jgi:hypothetical protein